MVALVCVFPSFFTTTVNVAPCPAWMVASEELRNFVTKRCGFVMATVAIADALGTARPH